MTMTEAEAHTQRTGVLSVLLSKCRGREFVTRRGQLIMPELKILCLIPRLARALPPGVDCHDGNNR